MIIRSKRIIWACIRLCVKRNRIFFYPIRLCKKWNWIFFEAIRLKPKGIIRFLFCEVESVPITIAWSVILFSLRKFERWGKHSSLTEFGAYREITSNLSEFRVNLAEANLLYSKNFFLVNPTKFDGLLVFFFQLCCIFYFTMWFYSHIVIHWMFHFLLGFVPCTLFIFFNQRGESCTKRIIKC